MLSPRTGLVILVLVFGFGAAPALPLELEDGGMTLDDEAPLFGEEDLFDDPRYLAEDLGLDLDDDAEEPDRIRKVHLIGIWTYEDKDGGSFVGMLWVKRQRRRIVVGWLKGIFEESDSGERELVGKIIDREGKFRGKLKGTYGKKGVRARWSLKEGDESSKAKAGFSSPYGRPAFLGVTTAPKGAYEE